MKISLWTYDINTSSLFFVLNENNLSLCSELDTCYVIFYNEYYLLISQVLDQVFYVYLLFLLVSNHAGFMRNHYFRSASSWFLLFKKWPLILANLGATSWCKLFLMKPVLDDVLCSFDVTLINLLCILAIPFVVQIRLINSPYEIKYRWN